MNWKEYFQLKDKRVKWIKRFFILLIIIHLFFFWETLFNGADTVCQEYCLNGSVLNASQLADSNLSELNESELAELTETNQSGQNLTNISNQTNATQLSNATEGNENLVDDAAASIWLRIKNPRIVLYLVSQINITKIYRNYIWYDCNEVCIATSDKYETWIYFSRIFYGPAFIIICFIIAALMGHMLYIYKYYKLEHPKSEDSDKDDKKDGKDKKKEKK